METTTLSEIKEKIDASSILKEYVEGIEDTHGDFTVYTKKGGVSGTFLKLFMEELGKYVYWVQGLRDESVSFYLNGVER